MIPREALAKLETWEPDAHKPDVALTGVTDFITAVIADPSLLERIPRGSEGERVLAFVDDGVPPVDLAAHAGKTVYVHRPSPEASAHLLARDSAAAD